MATFTPRSETWDPAVIVARLRIATACTHNIRVELHGATIYSHECLQIWHDDEGALHVVEDQEDRSPMGFWDAMIEKFATAFPHQHAPSRYSDAEYASMVEAL